MHKKVLLLAVLMVLALGFGTVQAQESGLGDIDPSGTTILYWHQYNSGVQLETMTALVDEFNATNEWGITVEAMPQGNYGDLRELITAGIQSGELPNLVAGYQNDMVAYYQAGVAVDLMPYYLDPVWGASEEDQADFNPGILSANIFAEFDGALLGWPNQISANVLAVNLGMLEQLGFSEAPRTLEEFVTVACAAAVSGLTGAEGQPVRGYPIKTDSSNFESMAAGFGGYIYDEETNQYNFTNEGAVTAMALYAQLYAQGCAYIPDTQFGNTDDFAFGLNPMALGSSAGITFTVSNIESSGSGVDNWIVTTTPWTEGNRTVQVYLPSLIALSGTPQEQLATWLFIQYLASPEAQSTWTAATLYFPLRLSVSAEVENIVDSANPAYPYVVQVSALLSDPEIRIYNAPRNAAYNVVRGLVSTAMTDVTSGGRPVEEVLLELEAAANEALADLQ